MCAFKAFKILSKILKIGSFTLTIARFLVFPENSEDLTTRGHMYVFTWHVWVEAEKQSPLDIMADDVSD